MKTVYGPFGQSSGTLDFCPNMPRNDKITSLFGFPNHCNGAEGIHDYGDLCKYRHIFQAKEGTGASSVPIPTLKHTNGKVTIECNKAK